MFAVGVKSIEGKRFKGAKFFKLCDGQETVGGIECEQATTFLVKVIEYLLQRYDDEPAIHEKIVQVADLRADATEFENYQYRNIGVVELPQRNLKLRINLHNDNTVKFNLIRRLFAEIDGLDPDFRAERYFIEYEAPQNAAPSERPSPAAGPGALPAVPAPQTILYGPPGTGKTRLAKALAARIVTGPKLQEEYGGDEAVRRYLEEYRRLAREPEPRVELIQFHPSYTYGDFVDGYAPQVDRGRLTLEAVETVLRRLAAQAQDRPHALIIDEINRAPIAAVFGELLHALEYRGQDIALSSGRTLAIPEQLYVIGTMNTADRSIADLDYAVRRRFAFVEVPSAAPDDAGLNALRKEGRFFAGEVYRHVQSLFDKPGNVAPGINPDDIRPGISYFICRREENEPKHLEYKLKYEILPVLTEYLKDGLISRHAKADGEETLASLLRSGSDRYIRRLLALESREVRRHG